MPTYHAFTHIPSGKKLQLPEASPGLYLFRLKPNSPAIAYSESVLKQFEIHRSNPVVSADPDEEELRMGAPGAINPKYTKVGTKGRKRH